MVQADSIDERSVLSKAFRILDAFRSDRDEISLTDLVEITGLPKPTAHRIAGQLVSLGALERSYGNYRLGLRMFELGGRVHVQRHLRERARPFLTDLYEATHETVHLGIREGTEVVYIDKISGHRRVDVPTWVGARMPLYCTAIGKALLAHAERPVFEAVVSGGLERRTPYTIVSQALLDQQLEECRRDGVAFDWEESTIGVTCAAVAILDHRNSPVAAVSVTGPMSRFDPERATAGLRTAAAGIARALRG